MIKYNYIEPFQKKNIEFLGAYCFESEENSLLLSKKGSSIILSNDIVDMIKKHNLPENLAIKLYQRGMVKLYNIDRFFEIEDSFDGFIKKIFITIINGDKTKFKDMESNIITKILNVIVQKNNGLRYSNTHFKEKVDDKCKECPYHVFCKGGCTASAISYNNKKPGEIDDMECNFNLAIYPLIIELLLKEPEIIEKLIEKKIKII